MPLRNAACRDFLLGILIFKELTAWHLCKSFGIKGLTNSVAISQALLPSLKHCCSHTIKDLFPTNGCLIYSCCPQDKHLSSQRSQEAGQFPVYSGPSVFTSVQFILSLSNPIFLPPAYSPALIYFRWERGWWITCNYPTVLEEININSTTCTICWLRSVLHEEKHRGQEIHNVGRSLTLWIMNFSQQIAQVVLFMFMFFSFKTVG
jgi:hypothetical protein